MTDFLHACLSGASAALCFFATLAFIRWSRRTMRQLEQKSKDAAYWSELYRVELAKHLITTDLYYTNYKNLYEQHMELLKVKQND